MEMEMEMEIKPMAKPEDNKMDTSGTLFIGACPRRLTLLLSVSIAIKLRLFSFLPGIFS